jgi:hypothetical protein
VGGEGGASKKDAWNYESDVYVIGMCVYCLIIVILLFFIIMKW